MHCFVTPITTDLTSCCYTTDERECTAADLDLLGKYLVYATLSVSKYAIYPYTYPNKDHYYQNYVN